MTESKKECSYLGCDKARYCKGFCTGHYQQHRRGVELTDIQVRAPRGTTLKELLEMNSTLDASTGCILWNRATDSSGYGEFRKNGQNYKAHRAAWVEAQGEIPDGYVIDHLCHTKACINVKHLRCVTQMVNMRNLAGVRAESGYRGVTRNGDRWQAQTRYDRKRYHLGTFDTPEEANEVVVRFRDQRFGIWNSLEQRELWEEVSV